MPSVLHLLPPRLDRQLHVAQHMLWTRLHATRTAPTVPTTPPANHRAITLRPHPHSYLMASRAIRNWQRGPGPRLVHAWGIPALHLAAISARSPILYSPEPGPVGRSAALSRAIGRDHDLHVVCSTATQQGQHIRRGVPPERCHLVRVGVDFGRCNGRRDAALRKSLGFAEDARVLLLPGDSTRLAEHAQAIWAASILHEIDARQKLLIWGAGPQSARVIHFAQRMGQPTLFEVATRRLGPGISFDHLLGAADVVLNTSAEGAGNLWLAMCMAAGLPIVSTVTYAAAELLEDHHTALLAGERAPRHIAQRLMDLNADPTLAAKLRDRARSEAYEHLTQSRFINDFAKLYASIS